MKHSRQLRACLLLIAAILLLFAIPCSFALPPQPGGPTLGQQAEEALSAGDPEAAAVLYESWLEAAPGDFSAWYNYACSLALLEREAEAIRALDDAVTAGWRNADWPPRDPDLESIRDLREFQQIIHRIDDLTLLESRDLAGSGEDFFIEQVRLAPFRLRKPSNYSENHSPYPLVILLHGRGGDYTTIEELADRLALPNVVYAMPRAPFPADDRADGFEYWPRALVSAGDSVGVAQARQDMVGWLHSVIHAAARHANIDTSCVVIAGFAQGGAAAYVSAMETPGHYIGVATLGGYLPNEYIRREYFENMAEHHVALFIGHGNRDFVVEQTRADEANILANETGIEVVMHTYHTGHDIPDEMVVDLADWIMNLIRNRETG